MGCGCGCNSCGDAGLLSGLSAPLMSGMADPMHVGAWFRIGAEFEGWHRLEDLFVDTQGLQQALNASDYVRNARVYKVAGVINPFIVIEGESNREYGQAKHLRDSVLSVVDRTNVINYGSVQFEAETYDAQTGEATQTVEEAPRNQTGQGSGFMDEIGRQLGLPTQEMKWVLIGGGALLVVLLLKK